MKVFEPRSVMRVRGATVTGGALGSTLRARHVSRSCGGGDGGLDFGNAQTGFVQGDVQLRICKRGDPIAGG